MLFSSGCCQGAATEGLEPRATPEVLQPRGCLPEAKVEGPLPRSRKEGVADHGSPPMGPKPRHSR